MQYGASITALEQGTIDAFLYGSLQQKQILCNRSKLPCRWSRYGTKRVFGSEKFEGSIITATKKFVDENPETVQICKCYS